MQGFLIRMLITALGLAAAAWIVPGVHVSGAGTLLLAAALMGIVNAFVRPIVVILTLPLTILTLGLFLLLVNAAMFGLVASMLDGFVVDSFWAAFFGWLIVWIVSWLASAFIGPQGRYQILVIERRG
jgi:putative membrane protein